MGKKRGRKRIYFLLYIACIFSAAQLMVGCIHQAQMQEINLSLAKANQLMDQGDFQAALAENEKVLTQPLLISKDQVLLQRGLIFSHPLNPVPDYFLSELYLKKTVDQFPQSSQGKIAEILILFLHQISLKEKESRMLREQIELKERLLNERLKVLDQHQENIAKLKVNHEKLSTKEKNMENVLKKRQSEIENYRKQLSSRNENINQLNSKINQLNSQVKQLKSQVAELTGQIEKMKNIDLNIEQKKKSIKIQ